MPVFDRPSKADLEQAVLKVLNDSGEGRDFPALEGEVKLNLPRSAVASKIDIRLATWRLIGENKVVLTPDLKARVKDL